MLLIFWHLGTDLHMYSKKRHIRIQSKIKGHKHKQIKKANLKTKRYRRDIDQVVLEDMLPENIKKLLN